MKLKTAQGAMERKMTDVTLEERRTTVWIRQETVVADILVEIERKSWGGHIMAQGK